MGVATPYPLESRFPPTFRVSQGFRCSMYSFMVDSSRKANLPFDLRTRATPSGVVLANTEGSADFMYDHIFSYTPILERCGHEGERTETRRLVVQKTLRITDLHTLAVKDKYKQIKPYYKGL